MVDGVRVTVRRKDQLFAKLRRLAPEADKAISVAAEKAAQEMVATAKGFVPVATGTLRDAITYRMMDNGVSALVYVDDSVAFYGHFDEWGTVNAPAQPFFWPSYRLMRRRIRSRFARAINAAVKKVAGR